MSLCGVKSSSGPLNGTSIAFRPIAHVNDDKIFRIAFINVILTSNNLAVMRPKKLHLYEQGFETQLEKSV